MVGLAGRAGWLVFISETGAEVLRLVELEPQEHCLGVYGLCVRTRPVLTAWTCSLDLCTVLTQG